MESRPLPQRGSKLRGWLFLGALVLVVAVLVPVVASWGRQTVRNAQMHAEMNQLESAFLGYHEAYGVIPVGSPAQVVSALTGNNPRKVVFFQADPKRFGSAGELLDPWRHPYLFDLTDPVHPKIFSYGPDKKDDAGVGSKGTK